MRQNSNTNIQITDIQYFGNIEFYSSLINSSYIVFFPEKLYERSAYVNRTVISGPNGLIPLSIPLEGGRNQRKMIRDVKIADEYGWRRIHWRSIHDSYRKSPWFDNLGWQVELLYRNPPIFLLDWNLKLMNWVFKVLKHNVDIVAEELKQGHNEQLTNIPIHLHQNEDLQRHPPYLQVFSDRFGFQPNLSILDLLFCTGPGSLDYIKNLHKIKR